MSDETPTTETMMQALRAWRRSHPTATFREMEQAVEEQVAQLRAEALQELAGEEAPLQFCAQCGRRMWKRGEASREIEIPGGVPAALGRHYYTCPACGVGVFPPGRGA